MQAGLARRARLLFATRWTCQNGPHLLARLAVRAGSRGYDTNLERVTGMRIGADGYC